MKRVRWNCPTGEHPSVLASTRPRKDATARFCLPCSEASGRLVPRVAGVLEAKREARKEARAAREVAKRAKAKERKKADDEARFVVEGFDLREELRRAWNLPVARHWRSKGGFQKMPTLHVRICKNQPRRIGYAWWYRNHIQVSRWDGIPIDYAVETLLHELAHILVGRRGREIHGATFRSCDAALRREFRISGRFDDYVAGAEDPSVVVGGVVDVNGD